MVGVDISSFGYEEGHSFDVVAETGVAQRSVAYFIDQFQLQLNSTKDYLHTQELPAKSIHKFRCFLN